MIILGEREQAERLVSVRTRSGLNLGSLVLAELIARLQAEICAKHTAGAAT
jgi:threonyl-tRNA synthetase